MYQYKRWMIGIDFSEMDADLLKYASFLAAIAQPEKVYLINVQEDLDIPDELKEAFPDFTQPRDESLKKEMISLADSYFTYEGAEIDFKVVEGSPRKELLNWSSIKEVDLILVGKKLSSKATGVIPGQLARKALCSVLFVPENPAHQLDKFWVAADFSPHAKMATEEALMMAEKQEDPTITLHHVYNVPLGYYKTGKTEEQFAQIMLEHAQKKYHRFLEEISGNTDLITPFFSYDHDRFTPAEHVMNHATDANADLILIGARGRNFLTALFLGSVAEKILKINEQIPLLLVKRKDASMDLGSWLESI